MFEGKVTIEVDSGLMELDKKAMDDAGSSGLTVARFEFHRAGTCAFIIRAAFSTGVCCHAWPFLPVWASNRQGGGEEDTKRRRTRVPVGVGCNAGRSFITLCLPFAVFASEIAYG